MRQMIPIEEAQLIVLSKVINLATEKLELLAATGRILAENVVARDSLPPFRRSAMDGYAVRSADTRFGNKVALRVIEELPAGRVAHRPVEPGTCIMLMTGAPLPDGADAVIMREEVQREGDLAILTCQVVAGANVDPAGSDIQAGETLLQAGAVIGPGEAAILASQGYATVTAYRRPKVALLSTGDELLELHERLKPGKIRNSNRYMLAAAIEENGGQPLIYPSMPDQLEKTRDMLLQAGQEADLVLSTGGVSMGDYDLVRQALLDIADEPLFWKVQIKPGMPVVAVTRQGTLYLGLSGKPNGALLNFYLLARPVMAKLSGKQDCFSATVQAELQNDFPRSSRGRKRYLWANTHYENGWQVEHLEGGQLSSLNGYNSLIEIPAETGVLTAGERVKVILVRDQYQVTERLLKYYLGRSADYGAGNKRCRQVGCR